MNVLIFYNYNFGIEDVKECFEKKGYKFKVVWSEQLNQRKCTELDDIFEKEFDEGVDGWAFDLEHRTRQRLITILTTSGIMKEQLRIQLKL